MFPDEQLCSHLHAVCYMAQSLDKSRALRGTACNSKCPYGTIAPALPPFPPTIPRLPRLRNNEVYMGVHMEDG